MTISGSYDGLYNPRPDDGDVSMDDWLARADADYAASQQQTYSAPRAYTSAYTAPASARYGGGLSPATAAELERQRELAFGTLAGGYAGYSSQLGNALVDELGRGMAGGNGPFTGEVQNAMLGKAAGGANRARGAQQRGISRFFAANGMEGGGGELAAMQAANSQYHSQMQQARGQIDVTAALENFAARERARSETAGYLQQRAAAEAPYRLKEADLRSRFEVTGQSPVAGTGTGGSLGGGGGSFGGAPTGGGGGGGGVPQGVVGGSGDRASVSLYTQSAGPAAAGVRGSMMDPRVLAQRRMSYDQIRTARGGA